MVAKRWGGCAARVPHDYDVLVIGSGFGGSVAALRLTEKGYRVGVLRRAAGSRTPNTRGRRGMPAGSSGRRSSAARASSGSTCCGT